MKLLLGLLLLSTSVILSANCHNSTKQQSVVRNEDSLNKAKIVSKANEAKAFCQKKNMDTTLCILVNMNIHSGKARFLLWNMKQNTAIDSGLVSHGCGVAPWSGTSTKEKPVFSNVDGSHCSSLGKYKIGERGYSEWGINIKYLLHGLEKTNNNALSRYIVLHSWDRVTDQPTYPEGTVESWGCPAVSNAFMKRLDGVLKKRERPVLLWMFN